MSQHEVDLVRRFFELWHRRDTSVTDLLDPDIEFLRIGAGPGLAGEWRGIAEMAAAVAEYLRVWEHLQQVCDRFIDLGDRVLVVATQTGRGRSSGITIDHQIGYLCTVHDEKITRLVGYWELEEALRAAGLEP